MIRVCRLQPFVPVLALLTATATAQDASRRLTLEQTIVPADVVSFDAAVPTARWLDAAACWQVTVPGEGEPRVVRVDPATFAAVPVDAVASPVAPVPTPIGVTLDDGDVVLRSTQGTSRLTTSRAARELHTSPDGAFASFVDGNDLHVVDVARGDVWRVTNDGSDDRLNGVLDWVYQEEVYGRGRFQGHWWSPDGKRIAFLSIDERAVKPFTVVDHVPQPRIADERAVTPEVTRYPKAGDPNPTATLHVADVATRHVVAIDLAKYTAEEPLLVRVGWTPAGDRVVFEVQNRIQTWLDLDVADPTTGACATLLRETADAWVNVLGLPQWLADGTFLWWSERNGYRNLYRYRASGELLGALTDVRFPMLDVLRVDEALGIVWLAGRGASALDRHLYRVQIDGGGVTRVTDGAGTHDVQLAADGRSFVDTVSTLTTPPELLLCDATGAVRLRFPSTPSPACATYGLVAPELVSIPARDGYPLDATVLRPRGDGAFAVFVDTYSGPNAPTVRNAWRPSAWHQFLIQNGVLVLQCNVRSASGRGQVATATCYRQFGVQELQDLEDAVAWVCRERGGDARRVGISGWSFGGFMAAYALTHSDAFALGFAGAGVHDWQLYDSIYTERYMSTPALNPAGYRASSVVDAATALRGHLVILHGTIDDNVHLQNSLRLVDELQRAGKDFELMLYPKSRHGVRRDDQRTHMRRLMWRAIRAWLVDGNGAR